MISFLRGAVAGRGAGWVELDVGGIGFHLAISAQLEAVLPAVGAPLRVPTHLSVREDGVALFGFRDQAEREAFGALTGVAGVGPKLALAVLSRFPPDALASLLAAQDASALCTVPGIGKKTAQRLLLELQGALAGGAATPAAVPAAGPEAEAAAALISLGYTQAQAGEALAALGPSPGDAAALLRAALRHLGGGR